MYTDDEVIELATFYQAFLRHYNKAQLGILIGTAVDRYQQLTSKEATKDMVAGLLIAVSES